MKKLFLLFGMCSLTVVSTLSSANTVANSCQDVENIMFDCITTKKVRVLLCDDKGSYQFHILGTKKYNTEIFNSTNSFKLYQWNGQQEEVSFFKDSQEYKIYANYSQKDDPKNIYDDNISGGVVVSQNGKKIRTMTCAHTPDSINFSDMVPPTKTSQK